MTEPTPELQAAIDVAKQRVTVEPYHVVSVYRTFKGHAQGLWAGTVLGGLTGTLAGVCLSGAFMIMGTGLGLVGLPLVMGCTGLGAVAGGAIGSDAARTAGGVAGVMAEKERREKADRLEQEILKSPERQREVIEAYRKNPVVESEKTIGEAFATQRDPAKAWAKIFDLKTMALTTALCVAAGMIMFGGAFLLASGGSFAVAAGVELGVKGLIATHFGTALGIGAAIGSAMGIAFGIAYPMIFTSLSKGTADILSTALVNGKSGYEPIRTVPEVEAEAARLRADTEQRETATRFRPISRIHADTVAADRVAVPFQQQASI